MLLNYVQDSEAVCGLSNDAEIFLRGQKSADRIPKDGVIISNSNANFVRKAPGLSCLLCQY
jgi:hypothetical protein